MLSLVAVSHATCANREIVLACRSNGVMSASRWVALAASGTPCASGPHARGGIKLDRQSRRVGIRHEETRAVSGIALSQEQKGSPTLEYGSALRHSSRTASDTWSASLSGWPSLTDSDENIKRRSSADTLTRLADMSLMCCLSSASVRGKQCFVRDVQSLAEERAANHAHQGDKRATCVCNSISAARGASRCLATRLAKLDALAPCHL